jgi:hypothetical protein
MILFGVLNKSEQIDDPDRSEDPDRRVRSVGRKSFAAQAQIDKNLIT